MKKVLKITFLILVLLISLFFIIQYNTYQSLKNPFLEIIYSIQNQPNILKLPSVSQLYGSSTSYRPQDAITIVYYPIANLDDNEEILFYISNRDTLLLEYRKEISTGTFLYLTYNYDKQKLIEEVEVSNSNSSKAFVNEKVLALKVDGIDMTEEEGYRSSSSNGLPSLQLLNSSEILDYLKSYNIDKEWLEKKSHEILQENFLARWFEKGSQRYSFENLGNLKIERSELVADD